MKRNPLTTGISKAGAGSVRKPKRIKRATESVREAIAEANPTAQPDPPKAPWWVYD